MTSSSGKAKEIELGDELGDIAVKANGVRVEIHSDGSVVAYTKSDVDAYTNGAVHTHPAVRDDLKAAAAPEVGDEMEDGTILAGYCEGRPLYAMPLDAPGTYTFNEAAKYAKALDPHGHHDFHVPSKGELDVLFDNRNKGKLAGTFNETGSSPAYWYWSSSQLGTSTAWAQRFSDGRHDDIGTYHYMSLRCVR